MYDIETEKPELKNVILPAHLMPSQRERTRIARLIKKIKNSPIHPSDTESPLPLTFSDNEFTQILAMLDKKSDRKWRERTVAAWAIGLARIPEEEREITIDSLRQLLKSARQYSPERSRERLFTAVLRTMCLTVPFVMFTAAMIFEDSGDPFIFKLAVVWSAAMTAIALPFTIGPSNQHSAAFSNQAREAAAQALLRQNALEAIGEILEGATDKSGLVRHQCRIALYHLLPQITEETRNFMPLNTSDLITKLLEQIYNSLYNDWALGNVILDYLEKFGQGRNVTIVKLYVDRLAMALPLRENEPIVIKGRRVVAILEARSRQAVAGQELLRHSAAPTAHGDQLLRPAASGEIAPADQLLRASHSQE